MPVRLVQALALALGLAYFVGYLWVTGDLSLTYTAGWHVRLVEDWPSLLLKARGVFYFEAIAVVQAARVMFLVSPLNMAIAATLAILLGANIHGAAMLRRAPAQCRAGGTNAGVLAALPALLAGGACCAPALVIVLGLPSLGALAGFFGWLIPLAMALLVFSRWWQRRQGAPALLKWSGA